MAALLLAPMPAAAQMPAGAKCPPAAVTAAEQFLLRLDARDYKSAYAMLDKSMRASLPYPAFVSRFDARWKALGGSSMGYAFRGDKSLAGKAGRQRVYELGGVECRVGFRAQYRKLAVTEFVTVQTRGRAPLIQGFRDTPVQQLE